MTEDRKVRYAALVKGSPVGQEQRDGSIKVTGYIIQPDVADQMLAVLEAAEEVAKDHQGCGPHSGCPVAALRAVLGALDAKVPQ